MLCPLRCDCLTEELYHLCRASQFESRVTRRGYSCPINNLWSTVLCNWADSWISPLEDMCGSAGVQTGVVQELKLRGEWTASRMKVSVLLLVLLQCLPCSGFPQFQPGVTPMAWRALDVSLNHINNQSVGSNLYGVTHSSVKRIIPLGLNSQDIILKFGVRETICPKSGTVDPETCNFRQGRFVSTASCSSQVRLAGDITNLLFIRCGDASSSSSESSSEEVFRAPPLTRVWGRPGNRGDTLPPEPHLPEATAAPLDTFDHLYRNNFLE
ncbi:secreted phosphoprotein 24 [Arapaima gigas]